MRNLVVLVAVLSMASLASAGYLISVDGVVNPPDSEIRVLPSQNVFLDIHGDGATPNVALWMILQSTEQGKITPGTMSGGTLLYTGSLAALTQYQAADLGTFFVDLGYQGVTGNTLYVELFDGAVPPKTTLGTVVDWITFHCEGPGDVLVTLFDGATGAVYDTQIIHQIPEPATLAILGLGALLLRRKK
jgi:hypothetical protein